MAMRSLGATLILAALLCHTTSADSSSEETAAGDSNSPDNFTCINPPASSPKRGSWIHGRSTYYGGPDVLSKLYDPTRWEGSFGILTHGSCGYTPSDGSLPFARDAVAAAADCNPDYPGVCGRCYQVKCVSGPVYEKDNEQVQISNGQYGANRPYLPAINPGLKDSFGRSWPGNPLNKSGHQFVDCWNDQKVITVRIIDQCPCKQVIASNAPGKSAGTTQKQDWCCGGQNHFDLSYWAFEKLAHPVYGVMSIDYRPVDCDSQTPLTFLPGYVSSYMYLDGVQAGWDWFPYNAQSSTIKQYAGVPSGKGATCMSIAPKGGLTFKNRRGSAPGYQPFKDAVSIDFWIKPNPASTDPFDSSTPLGKVPGLKIFPSNDEDQKYCKIDSINLSSLAPVKTSGDWFYMSVPMSSFNCDEYPGAELLDRFDFQNVEERNAKFCLADVQIVT
ncbi:MAG: hypothetical protein WDW38_004649 [Sanguina aurantia]